MFYKQAYFSYCHTYLRHEVDSNRKLNRAGSSHQPKRYEQEEEGSSSEEEEEKRGNDVQEILIEKPKIVQSDALQPSLPQVGNHLGLHTNKIQVQSSTNSTPGKPLVKPCGYDVCASSCEGAPERLLKALNKFRCFREDSINNFKEYKSQVMEFCSIALYIAL